MSLWSVNTQCTLLTEFMKFSFHSISIICKQFFLNFKLNDFPSPHFNCRSLKGIGYDRIDFSAVEKMENLKHIVYKKFIYCSNTPSIKKCFPKVANDGEMEKLIG